MRAFRLLEQDRLRNRKWVPEPLPMRFIMWVTGMRDPLDAMRWRSQRRREQ